MKEEIVTLKAQLSQHEKNIINYNESITGLNNKMINVEESVKNFNEKNRYVLIMSSYDSFEIV